MGNGNKGARFGVCGLSEVMEGRASNTCSRELYSPEHQG